MNDRTFRLGRELLPNSTERPDLLLPPHHFVTHGVVVGMTGSGKTGLCIALVEEALRNRVPVLMIDVKGDLGNLALLFGDLSDAQVLPWVDADGARREGKDPAVVAHETATRWREGLAGWGLGTEQIQALRDGIELRIITPGTRAGEPLHVLSPLEQRSDLWDVDEEAARESLSAAISLLLRMVDREADPTRGREHVLLSHLAERRLRAGQAAGLEALLGDLQAPPIDRVGALSVDEFLPPKERANLAQDLNALVASPTFSTWREGAPLDVAAWMRGTDPKKTAATIVSVAHLDDAERMLVLSLVLDQTLAYVRGLSGTTDLRSLVLFDEVFGFLPPHPANPPTKRPMLALLKQARAFGVGLVVATQNPIDLDYKALSNAGVWFVGRLQTDADRERVVEGLTGSDTNDAGGALEAGELGDLIKALPPRTFYVRDVHRKPSTTVMESRWTLSFLRGPMTRQELKRVRRPSLNEPEAPSSLPRSGKASAGNTAPAPAPAAPDLPPGWRSLFPHAPQAPTTTWSYEPSAAILASVDISDARLGYSERVHVALMAPLVNGELQVSQASEFSPDAFDHDAVPGARFAPLGAGLSGARAIKSREKALRDLALSQAKAVVLHNPVLGLMSAQGETPAAFHARLGEAVRARQAAVRVEILGRHDPKLQKLATQRDTARAQLVQAQGSVPSGLATVGAAIFGRSAMNRAVAAQDKAASRVQKLADKVQDAEATLAEAVAKRNHELATKEAELASAPAATVERTIRPKKDAVTVEGYAILWVAH